MRTVEASQNGFMGMTNGLDADELLNDPVA